MVKKFSSLKTIKNMKTLGARADTNTKSYKLYLRLASLEMERSRNNTERVAAQRRVDESEARCVEIDHEMTELLHALSTHDAVVDQLQENLDEHRERVLAQQEERVKLRREREDAGEERAVKRQRFNKVVSSPRYLKKGAAPEQPGPHGEDTSKGFRLKY